MDERDTINLAIPRQHVPFLREVVRGGLTTAPDIGTRNWLEQDVINKLEPDNVGKTTGAGHSPR